MSFAMKNSSHRREGAEKVRAHKIFRALRILFPHAGMMLNYTNNWELLVAVELSAQCTDKKVNEVTPALFRRYPRFRDYLSASPREFEQLIFQTGFYKNKTKNILSAAKLVHERFNGNIPRTMNEMLLIPGVGRKTANVVLGNAYGIVERIAVDTHVGRLARVFGFSQEKNPDKIERDLMNIFPKKHWFLLTYLLIEYGRKYCTARTKDHKNCPLSRFENES